MENHNKVKNNFKEIINDIKFIMKGIKYINSGVSFFEKSLNNTSQLVDDYAEVLTKQIKDKPLSSLIVAGGIGYILAFLLKK